MKRYEIRQFASPAPGARMEPYDRPHVVVEVGEGDFCTEQAACYTLTDAGDILRALTLMETPAPLPIRLDCPKCHQLHIDEDEWATKPHHTHACQHCGHVWRPAVAPTVGVRFLPGFKNAEEVGDA